MPIVYRWWLIFVPPSYKCFMLDFSVRSVFPRLLEFGEYLLVNVVKALKIQRIIFCIFWPAFGCCPCQTLVEICVFNVFCAQKLKNVKSKKFAAKSCQKAGLLSLHQNAGWRFYYPKNSFFLVVKDKFTFLICWKWGFRPALGVRSTQKLVKICNK